MLYDISRRISPQTAVWPGDRSYQAAPQLQRVEGESVNLVTLTLSPHTGSHADAYWHYDDAGAAAADMPLDAYLGRARIVTVSKQNGPLYPSDFGVDLAGGERLLIHSAVSELLETQWPSEFPYLSVELIEHLARLDYRLIGLDSPSVDALDSKDLPCHHALLRCGLVNLECLTLASVPDGDYELIALPLRLAGACASPVRAILRTF
jgi:arylformamidase